jgi:hypothetical protein
VALVAAIDVLVFAKSVTNPCSGRCTSH